MKNSPASLNQLLGVKDIHDDRLTKLVESKAFEPVKESISKALKGVPLPENFFKKMMEQVSALLKIDTRAILLSSWGASKELLKYVNRDDYPPDEIVLLPLAEHTITSTHKPSLKPSIKNVPLTEIQFNVDLALTLKGVILKLQNGRIMELNIGSCEAKGAVKFKDFTIVEKDGEFPELLGSFDLGEGIPINKSAEKVHETLQTIADTTGLEENVTVVEN